jgi:hypothetical protein
MLNESLGSFIALNAFNKGDELGKEISPHIFLPFFSDTDKC